MNRTDEGVITADFDLDEIAALRRSWGVFRDRRPEMYQPLLTHGV
jgi:N-carbamoylputrescine amidase